MPGRVRADAGDQVPELGARQRIDAGGRLVQDEQVGVVDQRAAQAQLLLHAAGELAGRAVPGISAARWPAVRSSMRRCAARPRHGRTGGRRTAGSPRPTAWGTGSCPAPAACRRCAGRRPRGGAGWRMSPPSTSTWPSCIARAPASSDSRLDLPTPSGPIRPTMRPAGIVQRDAAQRLGAAVGRRTSCNRATGGGRGRAHASSRAYSGTSRLQVGGPLGARLGQHPGLRRVGRS